MKHHVDRRNFALGLATSNTVSCTVCLENATCVCLIVLRPSWWSLPLLWTVTLTSPRLLQIIYILPNAHAHHTCLAIKLKAAPSLRTCWVGSSDPPTVTITIDRVDCRKANCVVAWQVDNAQGFFLRFLPVIRTVTKFFNYFKTIYINLILFFDSVNSSCSYQTFCIQYTQSFQLV